MNSNWNHYFQFEHSNSSDTTMQNIGDYQVDAKHQKLERLVLIVCYRLGYRTWRMNCLRRLLLGLQEMSAVKTPRVGSKLMMMVVFLTMTMRETLRTKDVAKAAEEELERPAAFENSSHFESV